MIAGLPGTGLGGIFYLLSALVMPVQELFNTFQHKSSKKRWQFVGYNMVISLGILLGFWITGLLLGLLIHEVVVQNVQATHQKMNKVFHIRPIVFSSLTLLSILITLPILNFIFGKKRTSK